MAASDSTHSNSSDNVPGGASSKPVARVSQSVLLKASKMAGGTLSSRILGLLREMALAAFFDRTITDAWTAAFRIPNLFRRILGEGALSVSLQPILIQARFDDEKSGGQRARALMDSFHALLIVVLLTLTVAGILWAEPLLKFVLDPQYVANAEAFALTLRLAKIMFGFLFFVCLYAYYMAILNSAGSFGWPAAAPVLFNVSLITSTVLPAGWLTVPSDILAWGVLIGGFLQMGILLWPLRRQNLLPGWKWNPKDPGVQEVLKSMVPGLLGLGLIQLGFVINMHFASSLGKGAISYLYWADRLLELPLSLIAVSLGTALLPTLSELWQRGEKEHVAMTSERHLSLNIFVSCLAGAGLFVLAEPIIRLLFQRGQFSVHDSENVASVLKIYALTLVPLSCIRVLAPAYYAVKNMWFPAVAAMLGLVVHVCLAPHLMQRWNLNGLNLSSFIGASLNSVLLLGFYSRFISTFHWRRFFEKNLKTLVATGGMIFLSSNLLLALPKFSGHGGDLILFLIVGTVGTVAYALISFILKHSELEVFLHQIKTVFRSRRK